jgi:hypothetical protein
VAAKGLPSGDIKLMANSAANAEVLRRYADGWVAVFGAGAHVRVPTWGVVAHGIDSTSMRLAPETMAEVAKELVRQNIHSWGGVHGADGANRRKVEIMHLGWLVKPGRGSRRSASIIMEFSDPAVANQAIIQGTIWHHQIHQTARFCRDGRSKLCNRCQKPGHVHSLCSNGYICGTCAAGHPTWECPARHGGTVPIKCANCGGGHTVNSDTCEIRKAAKEQARREVLNNPPFHRVPSHFQRETANSSTTTSQTSQPAARTAVRQAVRPVTRPTAQPAAQPAANQGPGHIHPSRAVHFDGRGLEGSVHAHEPTPAQAAAAAGKKKKKQTSKALQKYRPPTTEQIDEMFTLNEAAQRRANARPPRSPIHTRSRTSAEDSDLPANVTESAIVASAQSVSSSIRFSPMMTRQRKRARTTAPDEEDDNMDWQRDPLTSEPSRLLRQFGASQERHNLQTFSNRALAYMDDHTPPPATQ